MDAAAAADHYLWYDQPKTHQGAPVKCGSAQCKRFKTSNLQNVDYPEDQLYKKVDSSNIYSTNVTIQHVYSTDRQLFKKSTPQTSILPISTLQNVDYPECRLFKKLTPPNTDSKLQRVEHINRGLGTNTFTATCTQLNVTTMVCFCLICRNTNTNWVIGIGGHFLYTIRWFV